MTDTKIRIAIAEACGWSKCDPNKCASDELWHLKGKGFVLEKNLLDYPNDLNAMHEAEKGMSFADLKGKYLDELAEICNRFENKRSVTVSQFYAMACIATARQRAEAFLRTLGKWKE